MRVRAATNDDVDAVLELWAADRSEQAATADTPEAVRTLLARDPGGLLIAEADDGALLGTLVRAGEARLLALGARRISALVAVDDVRARAFWAAAGYGADAVMGRMVRNV